MNIHYVRHVPFEGLGSIEQWANARNHHVTTSRLYADDPLPSLDQCDWLIVMGGPMGVSDEAQYPWLAREKRFIHEVIRAQKPVLGICLGAQLIASALGARVFPNPHKEIGWFPIHFTREDATSRMFGDFPSPLDVFHWHGDTFELPQGAVLAASSAACQHQAFVYNERVIGLQFHLETTPQSAEQLIQHCRHELVNAPFIQSARAMMSDEQRFHRMNRCMEKLLDGIEHMTE